MLLSTLASLTTHANMSFYTGDEYAIGIFMWNTDSYWNRQIPYSPPNNDTSLQNNATASPALATTTSDDQEQLLDNSISTS